MQIQLSKLYRQQSKRLIVRIVDDIAYLVSIYDKADYSDIADDVLKEFLRDNPPPQ